MTSSFLLVSTSQCFSPTHCHDLFLGLVLMLMGFWWLVCPDCMYHIYMMKCMTRYRNSRYDDGLANWIIHYSWDGAKKIEQVVCMPMYLVVMGVVDINQKTHSGVHQCYHILMVSCLQHSVMQLSVHTAQFDIPRKTLCVALGGNLWWGRLECKAARHQQSHNLLKYPSVFQCALISNFGPAPKTFTPRILLINWCQLALASYYWVLASVF